MLQVPHEWQINLQQSGGRRLICRPALDLYTNKSTQKKKQMLEIGLIILKALTGKNESIFLIIWEQFLEVAERLLL